MGCVALLPGGGGDKAGWGGVGGGGSEGVGFKCSAELLSKLTTSSLVECVRTLCRTGWTDVWIAYKKQKA